MKKACRVGVGIRNLGIFSFEQSLRFSILEICKNTGIHKYKPAQVRSYGESYFLDEYKNQYKKTYWEDEENLKNLARKRLDILESLMDGEKTFPGKRVLEIGSATGFFLEEIGKRGAEATGVEISEEAARPGIEKKGLDIKVGDVLDPNLVDPSERFDFIFSFFTLEHLEDWETLWARIGNWVLPGGAIFLALPSFYGPSFITNSAEWFRTHPTDHFYDSSPRSLKKVLNQIGFRTIYNKPLSYHPSRDLGWRGKLPKFLYKWIADRQCYGDTFQIIAKKL